MLASRRDDVDRIVQPMNELSSLFERGGPTMYAIAGVAFIGLTLFVERLLVVRGLTPNARRLARRVRDASHANDLPTVTALCAEAGHSLAPVLGKGVELAMRNAGHEDILAVMVREARRYSLGLRRGLGLLGALGTMAPFLGLLGTVLGIMQALQDVGRIGSAGFEVVSVGVAEALITTATGIVVAVIIVVLHQLLRGRLDQAVLEVQLLVEEVAEHLARVDSSGPRERNDDSPT